MKISLQVWWRLACKRLPRILRLSGALLVAGIVSWRSPSLALRKIVAAFNSWRLFDTQADFWTKYRRYKVCRRCPLFYYPLRTCGTPLQKDLQSLGCYCNMESKVGFEAATCWIDENNASQTYGWKANGVNR